MSKRKATRLNRAFFEGLLAISQQMAQAPDLDSLLTHATRAALSLFNAEQGYLTLVDERGQRHFRVRLNGRHDLPLETINPLIRQHDDRLPALLPAGAATVIGAPLQSRGQLLGAIYLENTDAASAFQASELQALRWFADQLAMAIEQARVTTSLEERVRQRTIELEQAVQHLERAWLDAVESNRIRTMILANIAHDIRSPIGLSISALQTIREGSFGPLTPQQVAWLDRVLESLNHAISLTGDVFDLTKAELAGLQLNLAEVDMYRFMIHLSQLGEGIEWPPNVAFESHIPTDLPPLKIDATRIQQVVFNLLSNAQRFTLEGRVLLYAERHEHEVLIGVRDSGIGIPPHQRETIFERFNQGEQETDSRFRGTGLGLAICKELVLLHGGRIWVESEVGQYSDFKFTLPISPPV